MVDEFRLGYDKVGQSVMVDVGGSEGETVVVVACRLVLEVAGHGKRHGESAVPVVEHKVIILAVFPDIEEINESVAVEVALHNAPLVAERSPCHGVGIGEERGCSAAPVVEEYLVASIIQRDDVRQAVTVEVPRE